VLKQLIDELDGIDFRKLGRDVKGDILGATASSLCVDDSAQSDRT
jgi:hypothetical protein